jgi:uncharacterized YkwD family protein/spore coat assembly protein SafA
MKKKILAFTVLFMLFSVQVFGQPINYTVRPGDSMWKIASKYQIGISEIISANPQIRNPSMIMPGQVIKVPNIDAVKALENEVIRLVNAERTKRGLKPLAGNWQLSRVARMKSQDFINNHYFSHNSPVYGSPFTMMQSFGIHFSAAGENIAYGQKTPALVMSAWMNSSGHRANILSPSYTQMGCGLARDKNGVPYWTQEFIRPTSY